MNAVRIASDGSVVVAVPEPVDPKTGATGPAHVTMVLTQQTQHTAPVALDIQDIPQLSDYGTNLGDISRTYLNYEAMSLGKQLGALRALQASPINHVDTTQQQANVTKMLAAVIKSRNDVDRVITNNSLVIPVGTINGAQLTFDSKTVAMMDRMIGAYLVNMGPVYQPAGSSTTSQHTRTQADAHSDKRRPSSLATFMKTSLEWLKHGNDVLGPAASFNSAANADNSGEQALSFAAGAVGVLGLAAAGTAAAPVLGAVAAGLALAAVAIDVYHIGGDIAQIVHTYGTPAVSGAWSNLAKDSLNTVVDGFGVGLGLQSAKLALTALSTGADVAFQGGALISTAVQQYNLLNPETDRKSAINEGSQLTNPSLPPDQGFADVTGQFTVNNSQGPILSGLAGVQMGQPPYASGIVDPDGHYDIFIPTGTPLVDANGQVLRGFDPVTGTTLSAQTLDLSGAKPGAVITAPPMSGTCNDFDANNPDSDDPDCD